MATEKNPARIILPDAYPQMVRKSDAVKFSQILRSSVTGVKGAVAVAERGDSLRDAIYAYVEGLEEAGAAGDRDAIFAMAHDIRGVAGTAGLAAAGRIAENLCRYLGEAQRAGAIPEHAILRLHIDAIVRAARAEDESTRMGDEVATELSALVTRRLREV